MIEHLTGKPAIVFGNSSGTIVALDVLTRYPEWVQRVVAHEPPVVRLLPDATAWLAFFDGVYDTYRAEGILQAMHQFASGVFGSADRQVLEHVRHEHPNESNTKFWLEHELRQYPRVALDLDALAALAERVVLARGRDAQDQMTYQPCRILAGMLGLALLDMPGGHLGFMSSPAEFAKELLNALSGNP